MFGEPGLDFDTLSDGTFTFDVLVSDQPADAATQRSATCRVMVILSDENDNSPMFEESRYEASVNENAAEGATVTTVRAVDRDSGANGQFSYSIDGSVGEFACSEFTAQVVMEVSIFF